MLLIIYIIYITWALLSIPTNNFLSSPRPSPSIAIFSVSNKKHHVLPLPGRSSPIVICFVKTTWLCDLKCDLVPNLTLLVSPEKKYLRVEVISNNWKLEIKVWFVMPTFRSTFGNDTPSRLKQVSVNFTTSTKSMN